MSLILLVQGVTSMDLDHDILDDISNLMTKLSLDQRAIDMLENTQDSDFIIDLYAAAHNAFGKKEYVQAGQIFSALVTLNPMKRDFWLGYGICLRCQGQLPSAQEAFMNALLINPTDLDALYHMAETCLALGDLTQARAYLQKCLMSVRVSHMHPLKPELDTLASKLRISFDGMRL